MVWVEGKGLPYSWRRVRKRRRRSRLEGREVKGGSEVYSMASGEEE